MKSPISSVGIIEPEGILNGSTRNERDRNTIRITGKKLIEYSTHHGCLDSFDLLFLKKYLSKSQTTPVTASRRNRNSAQLICHLSAGPRGMLPAVFPPHRPVSCVSCPPSAFPAICACA